MLRFKRPDKVPGFDEDSNSKLEELREQINQGNKPNFSDSFWGKYKHVFMKVQHGKCGYCEMAITDYGDMEHYRPKSIVESLESPGASRENLNTVKGRKFGNLCESGYWWLAYNWENYLLSCKICNQPWKRALFPIAEDRQPNNDPASEYPCLSPGEQDEETPLLLNPFDETVNISEHLEYTKQGLVKPKNDSDFGKATIMTCGLDRPNLNEKRSFFTQSMYRLYKLYADAAPGSDAETLALEQLIAFGEEASPSFPGVCRLILEKLTDGEFTWEDLVGN